jgi:hypothetical protein
MFIHNLFKIANDTNGLFFCKLRTDFHLPIRHYASFLLDCFVPILVLWA